MGGIHTVFFNTTARSPGGDELYIHKKPMQYRINKLSKNGLDR
jgi:hypothetical protein